MRATRPLRHSANDCRTEDAAHQNDNQVRRTVVPSLSILTISRASGVSGAVVIIRSCEHGRRQHRDGTNEIASYID